MHYEWLVINAETLADAQTQLNNLDHQKYEVYATHMFVDNGKSCLAIIARRGRKAQADIRY
jgi:hypothetical protein